MGTAASVGLAEAAAADPTGISWGPSRRRGGPVVVAGADRQGLPAHLALESRYRSVASARCTPPRAESTVMVSFVFIGYVYVSY